MSTVWRIIARRNTEGYINGELGKYDYGMINGTFFLPWA